MNTRISESWSASTPARLVILGLVLAALIVWLVRGGYERVIESLPGRAPRPVEVGERAPDFTLVALDRPDVSLADYRGQVVVINFWATWCIPCRAEMPALEQVYQTHRQRGLVVLGVDVQEPPERVRGFLPEVGVTFPILLDNTTSLALRYRATGLPATFIVDRGGIVRDIRLGPYTEEMLEARLGPLLDPAGSVTGDPEVASRSFP